LKEESMNLNNKEIKDHRRLRNIKWIFNPPEAPHMGGVWERLVRSIKTTMKAILSEQSVNDYLLMTVFSQVEAILNARPLTPMSDDVNDYEPLTPSHFLIGRSNATLPATIGCETNTRLRKRCKHKLWRHNSGIGGQRST